MTFVHGKDTYISLGGSDISAYTNKSDINFGVDTHDVTTYGKNAHVHRVGLAETKGSLGGVYDNSVGGPRAIIKALLGQNDVVLIRRPEGTGSGKAQDRATVIIEEYVETNPVADMVTWTASLLVSDAVTGTAQ